MGWGTDFKANIFLARLNVSSVGSAEDKIKELQELNNKCVDEIKMLASANPRDVVPTDWADTPIRWLANEVDTNLETIFENNKILVDLYHYLNDKIE